jgi:hypothetical protein
MSGAATLAGIPEGGVWGNETHPATSSKVKSKRSRFM